MGKKKRRLEDDKIGGLALYLSILALAILSISNIFNLIIIVITSTPARFLQFGLGIAVGACIASLLGQGRLAVFMHESKHAFVSFLAGNRYKKMKIGPQSGYYEYQYTKKTAHFNAMITLAPYWFPLVSLPFFMVALFPGSHPLTFRLILGVTYGLDLVVGIRDLHPHQSDLIRIRGGRTVALSYIALCHIVIGTIIIAWVAHDWWGLKLLVAGLWKTALGIVSYYFG